MTAALPPKPSLEQLKKQAKDVLSAHSKRSPGCLPVLRLLREFKGLTDEAIFEAGLKLADAQFALAMHYGFPTWTALVREVEGRKAGLSERASRIWAQLRNNKDFARIIGGEAQSVVEVRAVFTTLELECSQGVYIVEEGVGVEGASRLLREQRLGEFLNAAGVQAPRISILEAEGHTLGIHRKIEGVAADSVELSPSDLKIVSGQLADLLYRIHAVPLPDACRILGLPALSEGEAATEFRYGRYLDLATIEAALAPELDSDKVLNHFWRETRGWIEVFTSMPAAPVFGHGDLWLDKALLTKTPEGYRLSGVTHLMNAGLVNLYDEFLRVGGLGLYYGDGQNLGRKVIDAYNSLPGQTRQVGEIHLRYAIKAFWFYLAHENAGEKRLEFLENVKRSDRGVRRSGRARLPVA